ncbi:hypothetical protein ABVN80_06260 [Acinetobacter baumannii]
MCTPVEERLPNQKVQYEVELKLDGLAISLWYENGVLVRGVTRGDGETGKTLLKTLKLFVTYLKVLHSEKYEIPRLLEVRGEVLMPKSGFENSVKLTKKQREKNLR